MASTKYEALSAKYVKEAAAVALFGFTFRLFFWADHDEDGDHDLDDLWKSAGGGHVHYLGGPMLLY